MTTSGVYALTITRDDILRMALEDCRAYAPDFQQPTAGQMSRASMRLNAMIKAWQAAGVGLWLNKLYTQPLTASAQSYLLGPSSTPTAIPRPMGIVEARRVTTDGTETPLYIGSRDEYMSLPLKSSTGPVTQIYFDSQLVNAVMYVWQVSTDLTDVIKMTLKTPIQLFQNIDDTPDFPDEWTEALHFNLALRLPSANKLPADEYARIAGMAKITLDDANGFDREYSSMYLQPNMGPGRG